MIAVVLLICFIVVLAIFMINWGSSFFKGLKERSESLAYESMTCSSDVTLILKNACSIGNEFLMGAENAGSTDFKGLLVRVYGSSGGDSVSVAEELKVFEIKQFRSFFNADKAGELEKIEAFPLIMLDGKIVYCSNNFDKIENVGLCSDVCNNAHPELCRGLDIVFGEGYKDMCCTEFELCC